MAFLGFICDRVASPEPEAIAVDLSWRKCHD